MKYLLSLLFAVLFGQLCYPCFAFSQTPPGSSKPILPGATQIDQYMRMIQDKSVAIFANQTSTVGDQHLVDFLRGKGVNIVKIFAPEHGFRGTADAGERVANLKDPETGITVVSLYGKKNAPSKEDLDDVDIMIFDIQDIGVRFYTYISSLEFYIKAAIENEKPLIILDRPNPNGFYVDGPVLEKKFQSFIGRQPVPVVYGMTIGEYAQMLIGEGWIDSTANTNPVYKKADVKVISCVNYTHKSKYTLPVKPSPNIPDMASIYLYPSTCFFEGTVLSEGRGTDKPFMLFGHPSLPKTMVKFTPVSKEGAKNPKLVNKVCYGWDLSGTPESALKKINGRLQLKWLFQAYKLFPDKKNFFLANNFLHLLAGNDMLMQQIKNGSTETTIRKSWEPGLNQFKKIRKKYLLYPDFE
ncbi:MAG: DUF1343 domain-containing protein [Chitinophagaceae bacterium]|nr:DUF1343 domain-containing protein [Chitinophagaceae bacterium]